MRSLILTLTAGAIVSLASPALAQPPASGEIRELRAQMERLQNHIKELENRLAKLDAGGRREAPRPGSTSGFGGFPSPGAGRGFSGGGGFGMPPFGGRGFGAAPFAGSRPTPPAARGRTDPTPSRDWQRGFAGPGRGTPSFAGHWSGIEQRLDRIIRELEQLRQEMRRR